MRIKLLAAALLLGSTVLPQSTCSGYRGPDGEIVGEIPSNATPGQYQLVTKREYAFDDVRLRDPSSWLTVIAFVWPVPLLVMASRRRTRRVQLTIRILEPLFIIASAWMIWLAATLFSTPASGAYLALGALGLYFGAYVVELAQLVRQRPVGLPPTPAPRKVGAS